MKRKRLLRNSVSLICVGVMMIGIAGCGQEKKSGENRTLQVVTDGRLYDMVHSAENFIEGSEEGMNVEVQRLSDDPKTRETEIQKLRTEIMAGKGPDVFLLDGWKVDVTEGNMPLFENPYQTIQSGALASLDKYMEKDDYWEESTYQKALLKAGEYDGRQYILPLSISYFVFPKDSDMEEMAGDTLDEWLDQAIRSEDKRLKYCMLQLNLMAERWMQPAVDYQKGEVLFDQEKWNVFAETYLQFHREGWESTYEEQDQYFFDSLRILGTNPDIDIQTVPDLEGRKMCAIETYGAVGMSSERKEEAYEFLMLFLNDRTYQYNQGNQDVPLPLLSGFIDYGHVPVQESAMKLWLGNPSEDIVEKALDNFRDLDGAYFMTQAEKELNTKVFEVSINTTDPSFDYKVKINEISSSVYNTYKMLVTE